MIFFFSQIKLVKIIHIFCFRYGTQTIQPGCSGYPESVQLSAQEVVGVDGGLYIYFSEHFSNDFEGSTVGGGGYAALKQTAYFIQIVSGADGSVTSVIVPCSPFVCAGVIEEWGSMEYKAKTPSTPSFQTLLGYFQGNSMLFQTLDGCLQVRMQTSNAGNPTLPPTRAPSVSATFTPTVSDNSVLILCSQVSESD